MDKAIETPAGSGGEVAQAAPHGGAVAPSEGDPGASAVGLEHPGADGGEGTDGAREKGVARRTRRRPRRTKVQAEAEIVVEAEEGKPAAREAQGATTSEGNGAAGDLNRVEAEPSVAASGAGALASAVASGPTVADETATVEAAEADAPTATPEKRESRRRRGRAGGRRKTTPTPATVEPPEEGVDAAVAAAPEPSVTEPVEAALAVETFPLTADRAAAEPISAGRPEIEIEPPTLPEPPPLEPELEWLSIDQLPEPEPELLEVLPPDLPEPPARERGRRRRSRGERAIARAARAAAQQVVEIVPEPSVEAPVEAPVESPPPVSIPASPLPPAQTRKKGRQHREEHEPAEEQEPVAAPEPRESRRAEKAEKAEKLVKEIIVNVDSRETRIAVIENNRLVELHVEREERVVGSIYKGRVANVLPGMDAAFVDIGLERNAFLYVGDILYEAGEEGGNGPLYRRAGREVKIRDVAKPGQEILVQVVKGPRGTKGARVSTRMSLPGRYIVLMPEGENLGVSRKIEDAGERERLRKIGEAIRPQGFGLIIRTEAEGKSEKDLRQDAQLLVELWRQIQEKAKRTPPPALIHQDLSLLLKTIRDVFGSDVDRMLIDSRTDYEKAIELLEMLSPELKSRVELYTGAEPIFHRFGLDDEIERLLRRKVWLKSGGYITIDSTEALTAIDVNTGKFIGSTSLADTILKTNLDAVNEIARQLRLRDLGGMIVLDFIDMSSARDRAQVMAALERALKKDRTRTKIAHISPLGLVEMTRKRTGETVTELLTQSCPYCQGRGRVSSPESVSIQIERLIKRRCAEQDMDAILVHAAPEVAAYLVGPEGDNIEQLEKEVRRPIYVRARHDFHVEKFEIMPGDMMELEQQIMPYRGGQVVECLVQKIDLITAPRSAAWVDGYFVDLANGTRFQGQRTKVRLIDVRRSFALGEPVSHTLDKSEPI